MLQIPVRHILTFIYVTCWSIAPYLPIIQGRLSGVSYDFLILNEIGYICVFVSMFLQYKYMTGINRFDLLYSINGLMLNSLNVYKKIYLKNDTKVKELPHNIYNETSGNVVGIPKLSFVSKKIVTVTLSTICVAVVLTGLKQITLLHLTHYLSVIKMLMTLIKNFPQLKENGRQDMKKNFPIWQTRLDITGSLALILYTYLIDINFTKISIAAVTFFFQTVFLYQYWRS